MKRFFPTIIEIFIKKHMGMGKCVECEPEMRYLKTRSCERNVASFIPQTYSILSTRIYSKSQHRQNCTLCMEWHKNPYQNDEKKRARIEYVCVRKRYSYIPLTFSHQLFSNIMLCRQEVGGRISSRQSRLGGKVE